MSSLSNCSKSNYTFELKKKNTFFFNYIKDSPSWVLFFTVWCPITSAWPISAACGAVLFSLSAAKTEDLRLETSPASLSSSVVKLTFGESYQCPCLDRVLWLWEQQKYHRLSSLPFILFSKNGTNTHPPIMQCHLWHWEGLLFLCT